VGSLASADRTLLQVNHYSCFQRTLPDMGGTEAGLGTDLGTYSVCWLMKLSPTVPIVESAR
jgi:hypothetical protein